MTKRVRVPSPALCHSRFCNALLPLLYCRVDFYFHYNLRHGNNFNTNAKRLFICNEPWFLSHNDALFLVSKHYTVPIVSIRVLDTCTDLFANNEIHMRVISLKYTEIWQPIDVVPPFTGVTRYESILMNRKFSEFSFAAQRVVTLYCWFNRKNSHKPHILYISQTESLHLWPVETTNGRPCIWCPRKIFP